MADIYPKPLSQLEVETVVSRIRDFKQSSDESSSPPAGIGAESQEDTKVPEDAASDNEIAFLMLPLTDEHIAKIRNCEVLNFKYKVDDVGIPLAVFKDGVQNGNCVPS